jgi:hypothetical protein
VDARRRPDAVDATGVIRVLDRLRVWSGRGTQPGPATQGRASGIGDSGALVLRAGTVATTLTVVDLTRTPIRYVPDPSIGSRRGWTRRSTIRDVAKPGG